MLTEFSQMEKRQQRIRLHFGAVLSSGERVFSVAYAGEKNNESYWALADLTV